MSRTHAAQPSNSPTSRFYQGDGEVFGKGGEPIPTSPSRGILTLNPHAPQAALIAVEVVPTIPQSQDFIWRCDKTTWQRNMDGWTMMHLLDAMIGPLEITLPDELARTLPAECRWHFKRVPKPVEEDSER